MNAQIKQLKMVGLDYHYVILNQDLDATSINTDDLIFGGVNLTGARHPLLCSCSPQPLCAPGRRTEAFCWRTGLPLTLMSAASGKWREYKAEFDALSSSVWDSKEAVKNSVCCGHCKI